MIGNMYLRDIKQIDLQKFFNKLSENYSESSMIKIKNILNPALQAAHFNDYIPKNPFYLIKIKNKIRKELKH